MEHNDFREYRPQKLWDWFAKRYDKMTGQFEQMYFQSAESTKNYLHSDDKALEIGCGTGTITIGISDYVKTISAIDISSDMLEIAKRKADSHQAKNIEFLQTTIFDSRFQAGSFDVILAFNILPYFRDVKRTMERIGHLLKQGGYFISVSPCVKERNLPARIAITLSFFLLNIFVTYSINYSFAGLEKLVIDGGFKIIETKDLHSSEMHYFIAAKK